MGKELNLNANNYKNLEASDIFEHLTLKVVRKVSFWNLRFKRFMNRLSEYMGGCDNERINGRMDKGIHGRMG